ncbi:VOC family protein [Adhaeretor mobilis]|uniref:Putative lyase n=1 Tax=Adhaeretor mobilis TaxID=1930276 RepID=A0A517MV01_9BACT|nr:VOC family protein [Adhaeretor mobilis]QDS98708.1 putative lyase [Adhaeretor mobilis]
MPAPLSVGPLNHLALPTIDPERASEFYCDVLGFEQTSRANFSFRGSWLLNRETGLMIHLIHDSDHSPALNQPINTRTSHIAMQTADYDQAIEQLTEHAVAFVERVLPDYSYRQVFFRDLDGNVLELGEWPEPLTMFPDS